MQMNFKETHPKNLWKMRVDGRNIVIKATQEEMEAIYQNNDNVSDYVGLTVYKIEKEV